MTSSGQDGKRPRGRASPGFAPRPVEASPEVAATGPDGPWRTFVGRWLEAAGCRVAEAARGDWEVALSPGLQKRWRRRRVRLVFDPQRPTLPRGAWFTAPGSGAGRKILEAAREGPVVTRRTALPQVPGAPENGLSSVCRVRGLTWSVPRLGPVRYEPRVVFHVVLTQWGGLPVQEPWILALRPDGRWIERVQGTGFPGVRSRDGLYPGRDESAVAENPHLAEAVRRHLEVLVEERERAWEASIGRLRDDETRRISAFFAARVEEEEERSRRRGAGDGDDVEAGDVTSLKLEWERRAAEVRQRWAMRSEVRIWGMEEWAWPVAEIEQEVRSGAVHHKLRSLVDVARGRPARPACPHCGTPAEMLVRDHGAVVCAACGPR